MRPLLYALLTGLMLTSCSNSNMGPATSGQLEKPATSKHSVAFNRGVDSTLSIYYSLSEAFVNWDSARAASLINDLKNRLDSLDLKDVPADSMSVAKTHLEGSRTAIAKMTQAKKLIQMRYGYNTLSDHLFGYLNAARYDQGKVYLHQCLMAFNDTETGVWVSEKEEIRNPYLGLHDPQYGKGMLKCGENKDVINYTGTK